MWSQETSKSECSLSVCEQASPNTGIPRALRASPGCAQRQTSKEKMSPSTRQSPAKLPKHHVKHQSPTAVLFTPDATWKRERPRLFLTRAGYLLFKILGERNMGHREQLCFLQQIRVEQPTGPLCGVGLTHARVTAADPEKRDAGAGVRTLLPGFLT